MTISSSLRRVAPVLVALGAALGSSLALAKIPAPALSDEAKAKAAEAAAKTAHAGKVAAFQLCKSMDSVAAGYFAAAKKAGKEVKPAVQTPACADPGPFTMAAATAAPAARAAAKPAAPAKK